MTSMSEYQYYEFRAIDRPLTAKEMKELRALSTRARISSTSFVNEYHFGDFKGDPRRLMEQYFDFHFYFANWGTRTLMLRVPKRLLAPGVAATYCPGFIAECWSKGEHTLLEITTDAEPDDDEGAEEDFFSLLARLRGELMRGDHRLLYLAWLLEVQAEEVDGNTLEPPVPPGLADLTTPQILFVNVMGLDSNLVWAAAERSASLMPLAPKKDMAAWVKDLPASEKDVLLARLMAGETTVLQAELLARYRSEHTPTDSCASAPRTVGALLAAAKDRAERRKREEARRRTAAKAEREKKQTAARAAYLDELVTREAAAWRQVDDHIATRKPAEYDLAVKLLLDLRDLARRANRERETWERIAALRQAHAKKPTLLERLDKAKLRPPVA